MAWDFLRSSYDTVAASYEATFDDELGGKPRDRELLVAFAAATEDPIVDVGCGPGQIGRYLRGAGRRVIGMDLSAEMAKRAQARLDAALVSDMRSLPFADASLGGIVAFYSVIHLQRAEITPLLRELHRVLRPGGRVLLSAHEGDGVHEVDELLGSAVRFAATLLGLDELVGATTTAGFDVVTAEVRPPYTTEHPTNRIYIAASRPSR